ncbi:hypothetical protein JCM21900_004082 [Sporobolomyces salmonicolor]
MSSADQPSQFRAAQFTQKGGNLEVKTVQWQNPKEGELVIRNHAAGLNSTDEMIRYRLVSGIRLPETPGSNCAGEVVQVGGGNRRIREGAHVVALTMGGALAEYVVVREEHTCEMNRMQGERHLEMCIQAFNGARIEGSLRRFEREQREDKHERRRRKEMNERMGMRGEGVFCVYGEGGLARLALDILKTYESEQGGKERVVLITPSDRFTAKDYGIDEGDMLVVGKQKIDEELRRRGDARLVIACDQPRDGLEEMLDGMRYGSDLVMLNPRKDRALELPIANILAKNISIRGAPFPDRHGIERALELAERTSIRIKVAEFRFDQQQVNEAWERMESRDSFEAPVVVFQQQRGRAEA